MRVPLLGRNVMDLIAGSMISDDHPSDLSSFSDADYDE